MTKPQVIENIFYDYNKATLRPESKAALDSMVQVLNDNPYITIEMGSHTDRVGSDDYNNKLSERRAKSVVDYLIENGVDSARLQYRGYGKTVPKVVTKRIARLYPQFNEGDTLNEPFVMALSKEDLAAADQINRRTEFQVLTTNYFRTFDSALLQPGMEESDSTKSDGSDITLKDKDLEGKTPEEISKMKAEAAEMAKMEAQKEREKAAAEGRELDPEGKYGENGKAKDQPKFEGGGLGGSTRPGSGSNGRPGSGTGTGNGSTRKSNDPNATRRH